MAKRKATPKGKTAAASGKRTAKTTGKTRRTGTASSAKKRTAKKTARKAVAKTKRLGVGKASRATTAQAEGKAAKQAKSANRRKTADRSTARAARAAEPELGTSPVAAATPAKVRTNTRARKDSGPASTTSAPPKNRSAFAPPRRVSLQWGATAIELADETKKVPKTKLTKRELREFEQMLLAKRRELVGDMQNLSNEALNTNKSAGGSNMPLHMADVGSDNWEQEFTLGLIENERALVREIDEALARIEDRTYGICLGTHTPIDKARLRAKPWAKYCIEYARLRELGRVP